MRQTLMGLGAVRVLNEPGTSAERPFDSGDAPAVERSPHMTMAGLPAVSMGSARGEGNPEAVRESAKRRPLGVRATMMGMPVTEAPSRPSPVPFRVEEPEFEEDNSRTVQVTDQLVQSAREISRNLAAAAPPAQPSVFEEDDDPLAGLSGVQEAKVSSLMEGEVNDLSAQVFGDSFSFGEDELDFDEDEDDELEVEFAKRPAASPAPSPGDIPPDEVQHDVAAAMSAVANMMADLNDVMPDDDDAPPFEPPPGYKDEDDDEDKTVADVNLQAALVAAERSVSGQTPAVVLPEKTTPALEKASTEKASAEKGPAEKAKQAASLPPVDERAHLDAAPAASFTVPSAGAGFGLGGVVAVLGALCSVVWFLIPAGGGGMPIASIATLDVASQVLMVFSAVSAVLAVVTGLLQLPAMPKSLVLFVLSVGLGVLSAIAPVAKLSPHNFVLYAAAGLIFVAALAYLLLRKKASR
jgi:hypothetical protein